MALLVPYHRAQTQQYNYSGRPTTTWGTTVTANAVSHLLGTKVELVAATTHEAEWVGVTVHSTSTSAAITDMLVNIYIGAVLSEVVLIPNLLAGFAGSLGGTNTPGRRYLFPLRIPRGSRLSADAQALITVDTVSVMVELYGGGWMEWVGSGVECLGADTAASRGTAITPGTTSEGSWTTIATSARTYRHVLLVLMGNVDVSATATIQAGDIGTGSALIPGLENFTTDISASEYQTPFVQGGRFVEVASGTALQARLQAQNTDAEAKSVCIYGVF